MNHRLFPVMPDRWRLPVSLVVACVVLFLPVLLVADEVTTITAGEAHERAAAGEILLIDVRAPAEWRDTGIGEPAHAITMHEPGFIARLETLTEGGKTRPLALICAHGGRSKLMSGRLADLGYTQVLDVAEGMLGSDAGPGWLKSQLPTRAYAQ